MARAIDLHQRPVAARRMEVDGAGHQVFAHPALAGQQHGGARGRHALDGVEDLLHGGAASDDVVELVAPPQLRLELAVFLAQRAHFERFVDHLHEVIERERLEQKIGGPGFHGFHRRFHRAVGGHHDHRHLRVLPADQAQKLQAVHVGQLEIGEHQVGAVHDLEPVLGGGRPCPRRSRPTSVAARSRGAIFLRLPLPGCAFSCGNQSLRMGVGVRPAAARGTRCPCPARSPLLSYRRVRPRSWKRWPAPVPRPPAWW